MIYIQQTTIRVFSTLSFAGELKPDHSNLNLWRCLDEIWAFWERSPEDSLPEQPGETNKTIFEIWASWFFGLEARGGESLDVDQRLEPVESDLLKLQQQRFKLYDKFKISIYETGGFLCLLDSSRSVVEVQCVLKCVHKSVYRIYLILCIALFKC